LGSRLTNLHPGRVQRAVGTIFKEITMHEHTIAEALPGLRKLLVNVDGCNKADKVEVLIPACIDAGIIAGPAIVATIARLGFNRRHVGTVLGKGAGLNPDRYAWRKELDGTYATNA